MAEFITLDWKNSIIQSEFSEGGQNIKIKENQVDNNKCYIYFSSNDLDHKDSEPDFKKKIVENNSYEWLNRSAADVPHKEIFIRDVWLSWYVNGANGKLNSLDKLIDYLKTATKGFEVTTVGVSSGGYVASIVAAKLGAKRCFDFSGQFSLLHHFDHVKTNPFLKNYYSNYPEGEYLEAYRVIRGTKTSIYYFLPTKSAQDIEQAQYAVQCENVKCIRFSNKRHGSPVLSISLPDLLSWDNYKLDELFRRSQKHELNTILFSMEVSGVLRTCSFLCKKAFSIMKKSHKK